MQRQITSLVDHILTIKMKRPTMAATTSRGGSMTEPSTDVIQGTLDILILKTVSLGPLHGYGITRRIEQVSRGVFKVNPGSLLTALHRLERAGWLDANWGRTENSRRAKYYSLTAGGRRQLDLETESWERRVTAMSRLLRSEA
jgi:transcriptional regulator